MRGVKGRVLNVPLLDALLLLRLLLLLGWARMIGTCFDRGGYLYCNQAEARRGGRGDAKINGLGEEERDKERVRRRCSLFFFQIQIQICVPRSGPSFPTV